MSIPINIYTDACLLHPCMSTCMSIPSHAYTHAVDADVRLKNRMAAVGIVVSCIARQRGLTAIMTPREGETACTTTACTTACTTRRGGGGDGDGTWNPGELPIQMKMSHLSECVMQCASHASYVGVVTFCCGALNMAQIVQTSRRAGVGTGASA